MRHYYWMYNLPDVAMLIGSLGFFLLALAGSYVMVREVNKECGPLRKKGGK